MTKEDNQLSPIKQAALKVVDDLRDNIIMNCDDEELAKSMVQFHPSSHKEYINPKEYCNADDGMDLLDMGYNRNKFFKILKKFGIKNHKVNNVPLGYKIKDIERIKEYIK